MNISISHRKGRHSDLSAVEVYLRHDIEVHVLFAKAGKPISLKIEKTFTSVPEDEEKDVEEAIRIGVEKAKVEQDKLTHGSKGHNISKNAGKLISRFEVFGGIITLQYSVTYPTLIECRMCDGDYTSRTLLTPEDARNFIKELENAIVKVEKSS